jgi:hypothetical protein
MSIQKPPETEAFLLPALTMAVKLKVPPQENFAPEVGQKCSHSHFDFQAHDQSKACK